MSVLYGSEQTENGLVEAVAVLISKMPRMRLELAEGKAGECFMAKPDFMKVYLSVENVVLFYNRIFPSLLFNSQVLLRCGKNGGHKLLSWTPVHTGLSVITFRLGRA